MVVDQAEAYSVPLANRAAALLRAANIEVDRQSQRRRRPTSRRSPTGRLAQR